MHQTSNDRDPRITQLYTTDITNSQMLSTSAITTGRTKMDSRNLSVSFSSTYTNIFPAASNCLTKEGKGKCSSVVNTRQPTT